LVATWIFSIGSLVVLDNWSLIFWISLSSSTVSSGISWIVITDSTVFSFISATVVILSVSRSLTLALTRLKSAINCAELGCPRSWSVSYITAIIDAEPSASLIILISFRLNGSTFSVAFANNTDLSFSLNPS
jgi:hypothetical protein